ncbi:MAG TPA: hypothetical protein VE685_20615 [Thermoanaerobaculia bacterium]|nr:hypothetical protein [Thermoanaerobaculia bacterium]
MKRRKSIAHHVDDWQQLLDAVSPLTFTASRLVLPRSDQAPPQPEEAWLDEEILNFASRIVGDATQQKGERNGPETHVHC